MHRVSVRKGKLYLRIMEQFWQKTGNKGHNLERKVKDRGKTSEYFLTKENLSEFKKRKILSENIQKNG